MSRRLALCLLPLVLAGCMEGSKPEPLPRASDTPKIEPPVESKEMRSARFGVLLITRKLAEYHADNQAYPERLEALTLAEGGKKPYLSPSALVDPWKRPYQYDAAGKRNEKKRPDVWSKGPDEKPGQEIGNWTSMDR